MVQRAASCSIPSTWRTRHSSRLEAKIPTGSSSFSLETMYSTSETSALRASAISDGGTVRYPFWSREWMQNFTILCCSSVSVFQGSCIMIICSTDCSVSSAS